MEPQHFETQVFDWGRIQWLSEPRVTGARSITAGVVTLGPGQGHQRHNRPGVEEVLYVLEGEGMQMVDLGVEERRAVRAGMKIQIPADIYHETINTGGPAGEASWPSIRLPVRKLCCARCLSETEGRRGGRYFGRDAEAGWGLCPDVAGESVRVVNFFGPYSQCRPRGSIGRQCGYFSSALLSNANGAEAGSP